jgi:hypothetical protein
MRGTGAHGRRETGKEQDNKPAMVGKSSGSPSVAGALSENNVAIEWTHHRLFPSQYDGK